MRDHRLKDYYEKELTYLRHLAEEFADDYPDIASRLRLRDEAGDPHVERLLQGFAFLTARIHLKVDDEFPEIAQSLLNVIYPQYLRPVPSCAIVEFGWDLSQGMTEPWTLPKGTRLASPPTTDGVRCRFQTTYETTLWPLEVVSAGWHAAHELQLPVATGAFAVLRIDLEASPNVTFDSLELDRLRWYLDGEMGLVSHLYELLCNNCIKVLARDPEHAGPPVHLPPEAISPVGFESEDALLPTSRRTFAAHGLLQEFFAFPRKHLFLDLGGLEAVRGQGYGQKLQLLFLISRFEQENRQARLSEGVGPKTLRLGCTPAVNLFRSQSRPIRSNQRRHEYPVSVQGSPEIFSIDEVFAVSAGSPRRIRFSEFYDLRHAKRESPGGAFWYSSRRPAGFLRSATEVYLSFVDLEGQVTHPDYSTVGARVTCTDGNLPSQLPFGHSDNDFHLEESDAPVSTIRALVTPTPSITPPLGGAPYWRLISSLSLNYLSLVDEGIDAFRETLRLYDFANSSVTERSIQGITSVRSEPAYAPVAGEHGLAFARGRRVEVEFDEEMFTGGGVYLFASVLERFLGLSTSVNSFTTLRALTKQRQDLMAEWPPRSGTRVLV